MSQGKQVSPTGGISAQQNIVETTTEISPGCSEHTFTMFDCVCRHALVTLLWLRMRMFLK